MHMFQYWYDKGAVELFVQIELLCQTLGNTLTLKHPELVPNS